MKLLAAAGAALSLLASSAAQAQESKMRQDVSVVAPALEKYTQGRLLATSGSDRSCRRAIGALSRSPV
jgi:hypothetical protein